MRKLILMVILLGAIGCNGAAHAVPERFRPLEQIKESALRPGTAITTIGKTAWVWNLDKWLKLHPPDSPVYDAILLHEREHAIRQLAYGTTSWVARYLRDTEFMRDEELRGWYLQLKEYQRRGLQTNPEGVAKVLAGYYNFSGHMIEYEDALTWVRDVLAGRWRPSE